VAVLVWRHNGSKSEVRQAIEAELKRLGHLERVAWTGDELVVSVGVFAAVLHVRGEITEECVVLHKCSGVAGSRVLQECRALLRKLYPQGESNA
jgi:hypothetical protein